MKRVGIFVGAIVFGGLCKPCFALGPIQAQIPKPTLRH